MSTNVPTISVTTESRHKGRYEPHHTSTSSDSEDNSDSKSYDMDYNKNFGDGLTDVEDFDSYADVETPHSRRSSKNSLNILKGSSNTQGDVTDIEDYRDSDADDEDESVVYPELKLSLQEFLQHDVQEHLSISNGIKEMVEHRSGNFLQAQNLNAPSDYLTDCEDYCTDSEIENNYEKSVCVDLNDTFVEQGRVSIADTTVKTKDHEDSDKDDYDGISVVSGISDVSSAISDVTGKKLQCVSEDEILELSDNEEICQISFSDSESVSNQGNVSEEDMLSSASLPPIDVTFMQATSRSKLTSSSFEQGDSVEGGVFKKMFLEVKESKKEEVLTDIERFDDSVAEGDDDDSFDGDDGNQQPIPQAVILAVGDDGGCITDCEDMLYDDVSETAGLDRKAVFSVDPTIIPLPQREVVVLQEDKYGDTITSVMPMDKEYQFGIYVTLKDECVTDTEEYSCADDLETQEPIADVPLRSPSPTASNVLVEPDVTVANEVLKTLQSKRLEIISNAESVTDVEEIYMAGTNSRKKKLKTRPIAKAKLKYLEAPKRNSRQNSASKDIENMDLSESGLTEGAKFVKKAELNHVSYHFQSERFTDVDDITADIVSSVSETEVPPIDKNTSTFKDNEASSKTVVVTLQTCGSVECTRQRIKKKENLAQSQREILLTTHHNQQQQTDMEDVQLSSDAEDYMNQRKPSIDCVCHELNEILNESCTTVHEKCCNSFNTDDERLQIKDMLRESHTDIEYVESDESAARGGK